MNEILYRQMILKSETGYAYHRIILDQAGVPSDYEFIEVNSAFEKYTDLDHSDIVGKRVSEILPEFKNDKFEWLKTYGDVALNGGEIKFEKFFEPLSRWYRVTAYSPEKYYFITLFTDITNEKEQFSELNSFFDFSLDYMCIADKSGNIIKRNQKWTDTFGNEHKRFGHNDFIQWVAPESAQSFIAYVDQINRVGDVKKVETRINCLDGIWRDFVWQAHVKNNFIYIQAEDITESKILKHQIETKEKMLLAVFEFSQLLLLNIDYHDAVTKGLEMIGKATNVDRVYYWENKHIIEDDRWYSSQISEWCKDGTIAQIDNPELQDIPFSLMDGFIQPLTKGKLFTSLVKDMEEGSAKEILGSQDIISILVLPVYVHGFFHGFVGFDDCTTEKIWEENEISLLSSFSLSLSKLIERNIMEREVNQARNNFYNFFNTINDMLFVLDATGKIIHINETTSKRLGYSESELAGKSVLLVHPEARREEANRIVGEMLGGTVNFCPVPIMTRQGFEIPVETRIVMGEWDGHPALFGVTKDITDLKKSEEKFSKAFHAGGTVMAISTIDKGIYIDVNQPFLDTFGYSRDEIIGKSPTSLNIFINMNDRVKAKSLFLSEGKVSNLELTVRSKDGSILTGIFNVVPLNFGEEPCWLTTMTDITMRKIIENELISSKESAIIANLAKSQFLSNMSHEIRTPMNAVIAYTELLNGTELSVVQDKYLSKIKISAQVLLEIINEILDLSRLESGKLKMENVPLHLDLVIGNAISQVRIKAEKKGLKLKLHLADGVPLELKGDPLRLQQILTNLLDNSVKFTDKGEVSIHVAVQSSIENKIVLKFEVKDTGIGMTEDQLEKVFEPFYQTGNDVSRMKLGTGLGLSICKHFVSLFDGEIWVESQFGQGTTFHFTVTLSNPDYSLNARVVNEQPMFRKPDLSVIDPLKNLRVLVVEDNEINQDVLQEILTSADMEVVIVSNGFEAITQVSRHDFDLVLMDVRMPGMDGFETTAQIRKSKDLTTLPIIAVSASVMNEDIEKAKEAGFNDYISKPIAMDQLFKLIAFWCTESKQEYSDSKLTIVDRRSVGEIPSDIEKLLELSPSISGIDSVAALHRLGGNYKLFNKLLKKFSDSHRRTVEIIQIELKKDDLKTAERLAHTLISSAGDIGARDIYLAAVAMESEIHAGKLDNAETLLGQLDQAMKKILHFIPLSEDNLIDASDRSLQDLDVPQIKSLLTKLNSLLLDNDLDAVETLDEVERITEHTVINGKIKEMKKFGEQYKYAEALIVLNEINKMLEEEETHGNR